MEDNNEELCTFQNKDLFNTWHQGKNEHDKMSRVLGYICIRFDKDDLPENFMRQTEEKVRKFCSNLSQRWKDSNRTLDRFKQRHQVWLQSQTVFSKPTQVCEPPKQPGRPSLAYEDKSLRSKRRDASKLSSEVQHEARLLVEAASVAARKKQESDLAVVLKEAIRSPSRPSKMRKLLFEKEREHSAYSPQEALILVIDNNLSEQQYLNLRHSAKSKNCSMYPRYQKILEAKSECRVKDLWVTDTTAKVPLFNLLEHTIKRIVELQEEPIISLMTSTNTSSLHAQMIFSYGFDGSSGQASYKQKFDTPGVSSSSTSTLFTTSVIPLRLVTTNNTILWNNPTPQSIRFCRPLKLEYIKETEEHILKEKKNPDEEIDKLNAINIELGNNMILNVECKLFMTLIDGKVLNVLTGTRSNQACPICGATPQKFLNIKNFKSEMFQPKPNSLTFGISPLHSWIRFFECLLHISYKLEIKKWQVREACDKQKLQERKCKIQKRFWEKMSLNVDRPKSSGSGNTNDGNTARRAFSDPQLFSEITEVDLNLIKNFRTILIALACQYPLNLDMFENLCLKTAQLYTDRYPWHPMTATVHKVLIHGKQILENTVLPVGYFGEDASESRHKIYKHDRAFHARKTSRVDNLQDIFNRAMDTSDPLMSSVSLENRLQSRNKLRLPQEVIALLCLPNEEPQPSISSAGQTSDSSDSEQDNEHLKSDLGKSFYCDLDIPDDLELQSE